MVPSRVRVPLCYCQTINLSHLYIWKCKSISWRESNGQLLCTKAQLVAILKNLSEVAEFVPKMTSNHHYKWTFVHYPSDTNDKSSLIFYASRSCHNVQNSLRVHKRRTENSTLCIFNLKLPWSRYFSHHWNLLPLRYDLLMKEPRGKMAVNLWTNGQKLKLVLLNSGH